MSAIPCVAAVGEGFIDRLRTVKGLESKNQKIKFGSSLICFGGLPTAPKTFA